MPVTRNPIDVTVLRTDKGLFIMSVVEVPGHGWLKPMCSFDDALKVSQGSAVCAFDSAVEDQRKQIERRWDMLDGVPGSYEEHDGSLVMIAA